MPALGTCIAHCPSYTAHCVTLTDREVRLDDLSVLIWYTYSHIESGLKVAIEGEEDAIRKNTFKQALFHTSYVLVDFLHYLACALLLTQTVFFKQNDSRMRMKDEGTFCIRTLNYIKSILCMYFITCMYCR
jgi:hypothetical protein